MTNEIRGDEVMKSYPPASAGCVCLCVSKKRKKKKTVAAHSKHFRKIGSDCTAKVMIFDS